MKRQDGRLPIVYRVKRQDSPRLTEGRKMSKEREPLVGGRDVSEYLGVPETTLYQW